MSMKIAFPCTLVLAVLGVSIVRAQDYRAMPSELGPPQGIQLGPMDGPAPANQPANQPGTPPAQGGLPGLSQWITYQRPECCGNVGCNGPIWSELYLLNGVEIPIQGHIFGHVLETGWVIQGGGRSLFFNPSMDRDWNIDLSLSNILNRGQHSDILIPLNLPGSTTPVNVSVRELNRTYVNAALGREWYFRRAPDCWIRTWRIGVYAGGRLGSEKVELYQTVHRTDVISGLFTGLNTDVEIPCGCCCTFLAGMRVEWGYTWSDIFQHQNESDIQDLNILFTAGVRF
jgi:hypothetical protein